MTWRHGLVVSITVAAGRDCHLLRHLLRETRTIVNCTLATGDHSISEHPNLQGNKEIRDRAPYLLNIGFHVCEHLVLDVGRAQVLTAKGPLRDVLAICNSGRWTRRQGW